MFNTILYNLQGDVCDACSVQQHGTYGLLKTCKGFREGLQHDRHTSLSFKGFIYVWERVSYSLEQQ